MRSCLTCDLFIIYFPQTRCGEAQLSRTALECLGENEFVPTATLSRAVIILHFLISPRHAGLVSKKKCFSVSHLAAAARLTLQFLKIRAAAAAETVSFSSIRGQLIPHYVSRSWLQIGCGGRGGVENALLAFASQVSSLVSASSNGKYAHLLISSFLFKRTSYFPVRELLFGGRFCLGWEKHLYYPCKHVLVCSVAGITAYKYFNY